MRRRGFLQANKQVTMYEHNLIEANESKRIDLEVEMIVTETEDLEAGIERTFAIEESVAVRGVTTRGGRCEACVNNKPELFVLSIVLLDSEVHGLEVCYCDRCFDRCEEGRGRVHAHDGFEVDELRSINYSRSHL